MSVVKKYDQFINEGGENHINFKDGLNESRSMAKWNSRDFKQMFSQKILESNGSVDNLLVEKLHAYYEVSMLLEARSNWFTDNKKAHFLDCEGAVILFRDSEAFIIEKNTFNLMRKTSTSWISEVESSPLIKEGFELINEGLIGKARKFLGKCGSFLKELLVPKSAQEWMMLVISLLAGVAGIVGIAVPGFTVVGGILMAINGVIHIDHGIGEIAHAKEMVKELKSLKPVEQSIATYIKAAPAFLAGGLGLSMGVYDITSGLTTALANPLAGASSGAIAAAGKKTVEVAAMPGGFVHKFIEESLHHVISNEATLKMVEKLTLGILPVVLHKVLETFIPWIWTAILKGTEAVVKGFEWVLDLPAKISGMITDYQDFAKDKGVFNVHYWVSKGLGLIVQPVCDKFDSFIEKNVTPIVDKVKQFITNQIEAATLLKNPEFDKMVKGVIVEKPIGVKPISKEELKPIITDAPTEATSGVAKDSEENKEDIEASKQIIKDLEKQTGKSTGGEPEEGGEKPEGEKNESKKWRYLTEFNKFNH